MESKYSILSTKVSESEFTFQFPDGGVLNSKENNGKWEISGSLLKNEVFIMPEINENDFSAFEGSNLQKFFKSKNGIALLSELRNPGSDDSNLRIQECVLGESFDECFVREVSDFCDGAAGCIALMVFPGPIATLIAAHCLACPSPPVVGG